MRGIKAVRLKVLGSLLLAVTAAALAATSAAAAEGPANTSPPAISGVARDEQRLKAARGTWSGQKPMSYAYSWSRCDASGGSCTSIGAAAKSVYKLTHLDVGQTLRVTVTASDEAGHASATSEPSGVVAPSTPVKKALPKISGLKQDGQLLSASNGLWKGTPPFSYAYRWEACNALGANCSVIAGATASSYRPVTSQLAARLRVIVTATNSAGNASMVSPATSKIMPGPPVSIAPPAVSGSLQEGQTLTAGTGGWAGTGPFAFSYQWLRCAISGGGCEQIPGATGPTYAEGAEDFAHNLAVVVTASSSLGSASATSSETQGVLGILPTNSILPSISGLLQDGGLLSLATGSWSGTEPISYAIQWQVCNALGGACEDLIGATGSSLKLDPSEIGKTLQAVVTATNAAGSTSATSSITGLIAGLLPKNTALPSISGLLQDGSLLSVATGSWTGSEPISYAYQWQLCNALGEACKDLTGATGSSLALDPSEIGQTLQAVVTATNAAGSTSATSSVTSLIEGLLPKNTALPSISGVLQDGSLLGVATGSWSGSEPISYSYQWQLCNALGEACNNLTGATGSSLTLDPSEIGRTLDVVVTATNAAGSTSATSSVTSLIAGILPKNTTLPSISGLLQDGQLLSVATGSWSGSEPISYAYQWQLCNALGKACENLTGATGSGLKLDPSEIGKTLKVVVTATNAAGSTSATSSVTSMVAGLLPKNTALPSISGLLQDGQLLNVAAGSWSGSEPISYAYQWQLCNALGKACENLGGATGSSLKLDPSEIGKTLTVVVTATNAAGSTSATSSVTSLIEGLLPKNTALPSISGSLVDGQLLSVAKGSWTGSEPIGYSYQWQLCNAAGASCANISEALGSTLKLSSLDVGKTLAVVVTATNAAGSTSATSAVSGLIGALLPSNSSLPSISGSLLDGQLLSGTTGSWSGTEPITYSYQWQLCNAAGASCANIAEAVGSTLKLASADVGSTLRLVVTAKNSAGSTSSTSSATGLIAALLPSNTALPTIGGLLKNGALLSGATGSWSGTTPMTFGYQWQLCTALGTGCLDIAKATSSTFLLGLLDVGGTLRVIVTATNAGGSTPATSAVTGLIAGLGLSPISGPSGTTVSLSGKGVSAATKVSFGGKEASEVEVNSPTEITAEAPAGSGTVPVTVTTAQGSTQPNPADEFTYR